MLLPTLALLVSSPGTVPNPHPRAAAGHAPLSFGMRVQKDFNQRDRCSRN